ncbi:B3/B4 domain-containing protein [Micromonospora siamensis]|uniref:B3/B4 domain-containing protein (DNA/RNA-binding domain of Phe-tRNA-synthetase) n=1 Tax=Micromonospora siamensis TaxID=299152 RepID=A0A1C5IMF0_9ACTN|nr:phenylalanine--tRNA ligase beta subunit-related protein [Micromonospora siamensis]SCG58986.1 B3/B4 domain-containing protein (DNA/RNA-binding domain of Phe-tRNA-synthetase) [Micromonospora siamensis]
MRFQHSDVIWSRFPELTCGVLHATGITAEPDATPWTTPFVERARSRLAAGPESGLPQVQAWRRVFAAMGLPPTRYRCAAESLLRRLRRDGALPRVHPLVDLCNALSAGHAVPVGVFDLARVTGDLTVRPADGDEDHLTFAGESQRPEPGEVIFADSAGRAHARRWTNRQSGWSAVGPGTGEVLVVVEAVHPGGAEEVASMLAELAGVLARAWGAPARTALLSAAAPVFEVPVSRPADQAVSPGPR